MGIEFFMMADKPAKLKDARDTSQNETFADYSAFDLNGPEWKQSDEDTRAAIADGLLAKMGYDKLAGWPDAPLNETLSHTEQMPDNDMSPLNPSAHEYINSLSECDKTYAPRFCSVCECLIDDRYGVYGCGCNRGGE